jgi:hypothetical protein
VGQAVSPASNVLIPSGLRHRLHIIRHACGAGWHPAGRLLTGLFSRLTGLQRFTIVAHLIKLPHNPSLISFKNCDADH